VTTFLRFTSAFISAASSALQKLIGHLLYKLAYIGMQVRRRLYKHQTKSTFWLNLISPKFIQTH